jgi:hypothetical protein
VDGVEEGSAVVTQGIDVGGLEKAYAVIHKDFEEVEEFLAGGWVVKGFH